MDQLREELRMRELEEGVVYAAMSHPDAAAQWPLSAEDFANPALGLYWDTIMARHRAGEEVDALSTGFALDGAHPGAGHMAELGRIMRESSACLSAGTAHSVARIVREQGLERRAARLAHAFAAKQIDQTALVNGLRALVAQRDIPATTAAHGLKELIELLEHPPVAIPTGLSRLDAKFSGLHRGDLVILQARPAIGKTAMGITLARNMVHQGRPVLFYTGEMPAPQILGRFVAIEARVPAYKFRSGKLSPEQWDRFSLAASRIQDKPLYIADAPTPKLDDIVNVAHRMHEQKQIEVLIVDYAQRIKTRRGESFRIENIEIAKTLKGLARELDICVLLLAQSGRQVDQYEMKPYGQLPQNGDVQESAAYEQEADLMLNLARNGEQGMLAVSKNRHGPTGMVPLIFDGPTMEFRTPEDDIRPSMGGKRG